jgi:hypothetical protein
MKKPTRVHPIDKAEAPPPVVDSASLADIDEAAKDVGEAQDAVLRAQGRAVAALVRLAEAFNSIADKADGQRAEALRLIG